MHGNPPGTARCGPGADYHAQRGSAGATTPRPLADLARRESVLRRHELDAEVVELAGLHHRRERHVHVPADRLGLDRDGVARLTTAVAGRALTASAASATSTAAGAVAATAAAVAAAALHEREKLWPNDAERLMRLSREFKELAEAMARGPKSLSAQEQSARQHYLAESERTRQAALAAARRQKHRLKADG